MPNNPASMSWASLTLTPNLRTGIADGCDQGRPPNEHWLVFSI
jgi:hypothetical protein